MVGDCFGVRNFLVDFFGVGGWRDFGKAFFMAFMQKQMDVFGLFSAVLLDIFWVLSFPNRTFWGVLHLSITNIPEYPLPPFLSSLSLSPPPPPHHHHWVNLLVSSPFSVD